VNSYKVFMTELIEHNLMVTVDAADEKMAREIAYEIATDGPWDEVSYHGTEHWTDGDGAEIYAVEEVQSEPPEQESHLSIVRTGT